MVKTEGLTHIHLAVRDLDRSLAFYQGVFGMEEVTATVPWCSCAHRERATASR